MQKLPHNLTPQGKVFFQKYQPILETLNNAFLQIAEEGDYDSYSMFLLLIMELSDRTRDQFAFMNYLNAGLTPTAQEGVNH